MACNQRRSIAVEIMAGELIAPVGHRARYRWQELDIAGAAAGYSFGSGSVGADGRNSGGEQHSLQQINIFFSMKIYIFEMRVAEKGKDPRSI